jgi:hypothetical protein
MDDMNLFFLVFAAGTFFGIFSILISDAVDIREKRKKMKIGVNTRYVSVKELFEYCHD